MKSVLKMGLVLCCFGFWGALSHAVYRSPTPGSCDYKSHNIAGETVCNKGYKQLTYQIRRQSLSMDYDQGRKYPDVDFERFEQEKNYDSERRKHQSRVYQQFQGGVSKSFAPVSGGDVEWVPPIGKALSRRCYQEGFTIDFCEVDEYFTPVCPPGRICAALAGGMRVIFSHYDKRNRTVCWDGGRSIAPWKKDECQKALETKIAKNKKQGWKCKSKTFVYPAAIGKPAVVYPAQIKKNLPGKIKAIQKESSGQR